ncbi:hypothetical protein GPA10_37145 [Streptomyces sp. p1417]|uniref:Uncharacterized protein n=1 Tax=Streptomyces typhae TaxID=2681492 RepID=A0A6L6X9S4_9ACTN|nr:hypothetical protein [Streptomyces typhae]MVO90230.1 hypothetical protein [Streptomyces typhae]
MSTCDIRYETDLHPEIVELIEPLSEKVLPLVAEVTRLPLGNRPVIRVVGHEQLIANVMEARRRAFVRDERQLDMSVEEVSSLRARLGTEEEQLRLSWMGGPAATVTRVSGRPEIFIVPEAIHHIGGGEALIAKGLAHELAHVGQHWASSGEALRAYSTSRPDLRDLADVAVGPLLHGHSEWTDHQVTTRLLGHIVEPGPTGRETPEFLAQMQRYYERMQDPATAPAHPAPSGNPYQVGLLWVSGIINRLGIETFNEVWNSLRFFPTTQELKKPDTWVRRMAPNAHAQHEGNA